MKIKSAILLAAFIIPCLWSATGPAQTAGDGFSDFVDAHGHIERPEDFRDNWAHLGSWLVKDDDTASGPGVHDVYTEPETLAAFKQTGEWPDGATLVKEIRSIKQQRMTTGNVQWAGKAGAWFVMIRDRNNRFPDNPAWGEGWGWALFEADDPAENLTTTWKGKGFNNCFGCHVPARSTEWVFIEGYPSIRDAIRE